MAAVIHTPVRAPALYFTELVSSPASPTPAFRLPSPPVWDDRQPSIWAAERRARKAYVSTLESLVTGTVGSEQAAKLQRLAREVRSLTARTSLEHLLRVLEFVGRFGQPVLVSPPEPLTRVVATVPLPPQGVGTDGLRRRYGWAIEWLQGRRFLAARGLELEWRVQVDRPGGPDLAAGAARLARRAPRGLRRAG